MAIYGLEIPAGDIAIPAKPDIPAAVSLYSFVPLAAAPSWIGDKQYNPTPNNLTDNLQFRITMAAIDPNAEPEEDAGTTKTSKPRATLKIIREPLYADFDDEFDEDDEDESDFDEDEMNALLAEEDDEDEDEEISTGPDDAPKSKKARKAAAAEQLRKELMEDMEADAPNGVAKKGKKGAKAAEEEDDDEDDEDDDEDDDDDDMDDDDMIDEPEEFVICTLDPENVSYSAKRFHTRRTNSSRSTTSKLLTSPLVRMSASGSRSLALTLSTLPETTLISQTLTVMSTTPRMRTRTTTPTSTTSALMRTRLTTRTSSMTWPTHASPRSTMTRRRRLLSSSLPRLIRRARTSVQPRRRLSQSTT